jgi:alkanesulfonate monooxygenase SsuD/methylene tetrahydromethanopterin reductase-like flavin-dependent oxidoreductase (luciferase family)
LTEPSPQAVPFEPTTLTAALATLASRIGFVATAAAAQHELYNLARRFASLDIISDGRVAWNVVASGRDDGWDSEYIAVVGALWESWDHDAFVYDKAGGWLFMPDKMHVLDHRGEHFTVRGPLNVNRSPQGKPVIAHVMTPDTMAIGVQAADLMFLPGGSRAVSATLAADVELRLKAGGRNRAEVRILAHVIPWVGTTAAEARALHDRLSDFPAMPADLPQGCPLIGTSMEIADALQVWFERSAIDGFVILPPVARCFDLFMDCVVPELRGRGLFRGRYEGTTLRHHLGLLRS